MQVVFHERAAIDPPWTSIAGVALGEGSLHRYLLAETDGIPRLRLELRHTHRDESWFRTQAIGWNGIFAIGFAERVYGVSPSGTETWRVDLPSYFAELRAQGDRLLAASAQEITCLDRRGTILWRSEPLGIDGVVIGAVDDSVISGDGEWDPPGGWRPFAISLADGRRVGNAPSAAG